MRKILLLLFVPACINVHAQTKRDNTIVIPGNFSVSKIKMVLFSKGYVMEENSDTLFFNTQPKALRSYVAVKILVAKTDSAVFIKGLWKETMIYRKTAYITQNEYAMLEYRHSNKEGWKEMDNIAKQLSNYIKYIRQ